VAGSPVIGRRRGAFSTLLRRPGLQASSDGVLATKKRTQNVSEYMLVLALCLVYYSEAGTGRAAYVPLPNPLIMVYGLLFACRWHCVPSTCKRLIGTEVPDCHGTRKMPLSGVAPIIVSSAFFMARKTEFGAVSNRVVDVYGQFTSIE